jgi:hypothetical protein
MTDVRNVVANGEGKVLANFRELPIHCLTLAEEIIEQLHNAGIGGLILMGNPGEPVCGIEVGLNRVGMILLGGLTPVAAAVEAGIEVDNRAMSTLLDYETFVDFEQLL